ncbi:ankyrin repeat domain-containing protein [Bacillus sp. NP157]|nr:ankyrin repeat domain-containing protein [Bacillus sp. NP157]
MNNFSNNIYWLDILNGVVGLDDASLLETLYDERDLPCDFFCEEGYPDSVLSLAARRGAFNCLSLAIEKFPGERIPNWPGLIENILGHVSFLRDSGTLSDCEIARSEAAMYALLPDDEEPTGRLAVELAPLAHLYSEGFVELCVPTKVAHNGIIVFLKSLISTCEQTHEHGISEIHEDGIVAVLEALYKNGAEPGASASDGPNALHLACSYGLSRIAAWLLNHGADHHSFFVDASGRRRTPLGCLRGSNEAKTRIRKHFWAYREADQLRKCLSGDLRATASPSCDAHRL